MTEEVIRGENGTEHLSVQEVKFPHLQVHIEGIPLYILADTGSDCNVLGEVIYKKLLETSHNGKIERFPVKGIRVRGAFEKCSWIVKHQILVEVRVDDKKFNASFYIIPGDKVIIGIPTLVEMKTIIDAGQRKIYFFGNKPHKYSLDLKSNKNLNLNQINKIIEEDTWKTKMQLICKADETAATAIISDVYLKYKSVFSKQPGKAVGVECRLQFHSSPVIRHKSYPIPHAYRESVREQIQDIGSSRASLFQRAARSRAHL